MVDMAENIALTESTYYILLSLYTPQHGYGIMQMTSQLSKGEVTIGSGTMYGATSNMMKKGWIKVNKKYYYFSKTTGKMQKSKWIGRYYVNSKGIRTKKK